MKKKKKSFWVVLGLGALVIMLLILATTIITIGDKLGKISIYVELGFYGLAAVLLTIFFFRPILIIVCAPTLSVQTVLERDKRKYRRKYRKVAKNLLKDDMLDEIDKEALSNSLNQQETLEKEMNRVFNKTIKKELNKIIIRNAKTVMISTAISQNGRLDAMMILSVNLKMIKELVVKCGFRPSYANLGKLSVNVLGTALIAEGLENLDITDILPASATSFLAEIPLIKPIMSSVTQGIANALLTARIGIVTRKYLFSDTPITSKNKIRLESIKESIKMVPLIVKEALTILPAKIGRLFKKGNTEEAED